MTFTDGQNTPSAGSSSPADFAEQTGPGQKLPSYGASAPRWTTVQPLAPSCGIAVVEKVGDTLGQTSA